MIMPDEHRKLLMLHQSRAEEEPEETPNDADEAPGEKEAESPHEPIPMSEWALLGIPAAVGSGAGYLVGLVFPAVPLVVDGGFVGIISFWWLLKENKRKQKRQNTKAVFDEALEIGWVGAGIISPLLLLGRLYVKDQARARLGPAAALVK